MQQSDEAVENAQVAIIDLVCYFRNGTVNAGERR